MVNGFPMDIESSASTLPHPVVSGRGSAPSSQLAGLRWWTAGLLLGAIGALTWQAVYAFLGPNFQTIDPGLSYRSAKPSQAWLRQTMAEYRIRTVINLRGPYPASPDYEEARQIVQEWGGRHADLMLSASFPPYPEDMRRLLKLFDESERPLLIHCYTGADRTGLVAALYLLLYTETPLAEARGQLHWRFGHFGQGKKACQLKVIDQYADWLRARAVQHSPERLRHWMLHDYRREASLASAQ